MKHFMTFSVFFILLSSPILSIAEDENKQQRFSEINSGVVLDSETGLMWATKDNGAEINWYTAEKYCQEYKAGGFDDWRLPSQKELETLFDSKDKSGKEFHIKGQINLTACCPWTSDESLNSAGIFSFRTGKRPWGFKNDTGELRALPVRGGKQ